MSKKTKPSKAEKVAKQATSIAAANPTLIIGAIAVIGTGFILYKAAKKVDNLMSYDNTEQGGGSLTPTGNLSITNNQAQLIASNVLQTLNNWCVLNSCIEKMLNDVLDALSPIKSTGDYALVSSAFGKPRFDGFVQSPWPAPKRNMTYWLQTKFKLDRDKYNQLKALIPGI